MLTWEECLGMVTTDPALRAHLEAHDPELLVEAEAALAEERMEVNA